MGEIKVHALSRSMGSIANCIVTPISVRDNFGLGGKSLDTYAIWDTGATHSVITEHLAQKLGLFPLTQTDVSNIISLAASQLEYYSYYLGESASNILPNNSQVQVKFRLRYSLVSAEDAYNSSSIAFYTFVNDGWDSSYLNDLTNSPTDVPAQCRLYSTYPGTLANDGYYLLDDTSSPATYKYIRVVSGSITEMNNYTPITTKLYIDYVYDVGSTATPYFKVSNAGTSTSSRTWTVTQVSYYTSSKTFISSATFSRWNEITLAVGESSGSISAVLSPPTNAVYVKITNYSGPTANISQYTVIE